MTTLSGYRHLLPGQLLLGATLAAGLAASPLALAESNEAPIRVGILHSLSGTMAISESTLKDELLMLIEQQNEAGGLLGRELEPVVVDPASDWPLFAEQARDLLSGDDRVDVIFGNWTSASRKAVLPVVEERNGLLFYPVQYEGEESSENIFYTGAAPNQQAIPAVEYLMAQGVERWALLGTDYVYPRTTNRILETYLKDQGVSDEDIMVNYTPFGFSDWQSIVSEVASFGRQGKSTAIISTINGDANVPFYRELSNQGVEASEIPVMAFSVGEQELTGIDAAPLVGHMAAWNYFMSVDSDANFDFIDSWIAFNDGDESAVTNDPMEAHYIGFNMWLEAVRKAESVEVDAVKEAIIGVTVPNLSGDSSAMMPNHHITKPVLIGEIQADGQFSVVWRSPSSIAGDAWSDYLPDSRNMISDWRAPLNCGRLDVSSMRCEDGEPRVSP